MSYILHSVKTSWSQLTSTNLTTANYYGAWLSAWSNQADVNYMAAEDLDNGWDNLARSNTYFKASAYYFGGEYIQCAHM